MGPIDDEIVARLRVEASHGDEDFFPQYVEYFCQDLEQAGKDLSAAARGKDTCLLLQAAHRLRGAAGNFGAHPLVELCVQVEHQAKESHISEALVTLTSLQAELQRVEEAVRALRV